MIRLNRLNINLGLPSLLTEWQALFSPRYLLNDLVAGITVAFVAIPLSLAIALASGVSAGTGLVTAIIAGFVCALFGGTRLAVSGPAAAMSVLIADIVEKFGLNALVLICLIAGLMQLLSGILGFGRLGRYVPLPVIGGFTAGIGAIILVGQLPRAFGLEPPAESHVFDVIRHISLYLHQINGTCIFLVALTIGCIRGLPKAFPKVPSILPAVVIASMVAYVFHLSVPLIGKIPRELPMPHFPQLVQTISWNDLLFNAFIVYLLASLETLLSSCAVDKLAGGKAHNPDQELIGQGLGNIIVSMFGGIPITGVIARSATNVKAGAKTRRASLIHSFILLLTVYFAAPLIGLIPIAALASVLFIVGVSMMNYRELYHLWATSRYEASIYGITFLTIIFVDLLAGVQAGIMAACLIVLLRSTKTHFNVSTSSHDGIVRVSCIGALTFLSTGMIEDLKNKLVAEYPGQIIVLDLSSIRNLDTSGVTAIVDLYNYCKEHEARFYIKGLPRRFESLFQACGGMELINERYIISEQDLRQKETEDAPKSSRGRLLHGVQQFYTESKHNDKRLFEYISKQQNPHTLFITCSDSRVIPSMITSTDPGELFIIRNIGNFIPPYSVNSKASESAAIEFALSNFDITDIVICGHASCGAITACLHAKDESLSPALQSWVAMIRSQLDIEDSLGIDDAVRMNAMNQIKNLKQYPIVQEKLAAKMLTMHVWFFDFAQNTVYELDPVSMDFKSVVPHLA